MFCGGSSIKPAAFCYRESYPNRSGQCRPKENCETTSTYIVCKCCVLFRGFTWNVKILYRE